MFTQAYQHGLMQLLPYAGLTPLTQSSPACHPAAIAQSLRKVFPWNACAQHKQDAVEGGFITDGAAAATFAGCNERGNEGLQLLPQLFADGGAGHKAAKHKCVCSLQIAVVLAALSTAGGVRLEALDEHGMCSALPGVFCAGEMLDWEAPTGGYLLTASMASGRVAGDGALRWLRGLSA